VLTPGVLAFDLTTTGPGRAHTFAWSGEKGYIPVFTSSCSPASDPAPDYGLTACALTDGGIPPWSPDMSGHVVGDKVSNLGAGTTRVSIPLTQAGFAKLASGGSALISFETPNDEVQAFDVPLAATSADGGVGGQVPATLSLTLGPPPAFSPFIAGVANDYFASTTATVTSSAGDAALIVQDTSPFYTNHLVNGAYALPQELQVANNAGVYQTMPAGLHFWSGPTSSEPVEVKFKQSIGADDALRTGSYSKTLTFTLSTTNP
jgi:hypothetical protein